MSDLKKGLLLGLLSLLGLNSGLETRARQGAEAQLLETFHHTGKAKAIVRPRSEFGLFSNDLWSVDLYGVGQVGSELPFQIEPRSGWKGSIRHLRLHLSQFTIRGNEIAQLDADLPNVKYDLGHALYKSRLVIRAAETGPGRVQIDRDSLRKFLSRKYKGLIENPEVWFQNGRAHLSGTLHFAGIDARFRASGRPVVREGRYVDLTDPQYESNGKFLSGARAEGLLSFARPLLDTENDLGLAKIFQMQAVYIINDRIQVDGLVTLPLQQNRQPDAQEKEHVKSRASIGTAAAAHPAL